MRSLKHKLVLLILPLCLIPLVGISVFSYRIAEDRITEDRTVLYLEQLAQGIAYSIRLSLLEKEEEVLSMSLYSSFRAFLSDPQSPRPTVLLNSLVEIHEVYDLLVLFDLEGRVVVTNSADRNAPDRELPAAAIQGLVGQRLQSFLPNQAWLSQVLQGGVGFVDWHRSDLTPQLYAYEQEDIARQYNIGFAAPILNDSGAVQGGILALMNWEYIQEILDKVEEDLEEHSLRTGYAFLFGRDHNTIIGHKYRKNRNQGTLQENSTVQGPNNYNTHLIEDHGLVDLQLAVDSGATHYQYQYPAETAKTSGMAAIDHEYYRWVCGVGIDNEEIFAPVQELKQILISVGLFSALTVVGLTYWLARQITVPLEKLASGTQTISGGDLSKRVAVSGRDEIGVLATAFNEMAASLEERSRALLELNRMLEKKVRERTNELEKSHLETQNAYDELKETQVQLVQSEKMASLGQMVAGIAHEIKNPLNFIYGNTDFLKQYIGNLKHLIQLYEKDQILDERTRVEIQAWKDDVHFEFLLDDLETLIQNFEEGAERIASIIGDLRAFSRMDSDQFQSTDIHDSIELALNLLQNEYRDRVRIHRDYGSPPQVECNPGKISQVFMNLLSNACHAIKKDGDIWIRTQSEGGKFVTVEIEDNGEGIPLEVQSKVFEPFFTSKPVGKGTGLGLSISYGIIQQHEGEILLKSEVGRGSLFTVRLPVTHGE